MKRAEREILQLRELPTAGAVVFRQTRTLRFHATALSTLRSS
jgi:hypothetical protein